MVAAEKGPEHSRRVRVCPPEAPSTPERPNACSCNCSPTHAGDHRSVRLPPDMSPPRAQAVALEIAPDGDKPAVGHADGSIRLWRLSDVPHASSSAGTRAQSARCASARRQRRCCQDRSTRISLCGMSSPRLASAASVAIGEP